MRKTMLGALVISLVISVPITAMTALAQADKAQIVKDRQTVMKSLWPDYYSAFAQAAKGERSDLAVVADKARQASDTVRKIPALFPSGTGREAIPDTRAKPELWSQRAEFEAAVARLVAETDKFADAAKAGNADAVRAQFANVSNACGACHGGPRKSGGKFRFEEQ